MITKRVKTDVHFILFLSDIDGYVLLATVTI